MTVAANTDQVAEDAIYFIARQIIHPDPEQPRVHPDDELKASIEAQGIIQPITVRPHPELPDEWLLVDGERRWRGAAVGDAIPCRIRLDLEDPADRLITQLSANTGKPLSPIEQARAFKKILDDQDGLSQAELAKRLGIPRSTIGDRIRLIEIHPAWMKLIESGRLQVSHAPIIHQYRAVLDEYQVKAAQSVTEGQGWQMRRFEDKSDVIPIADFRKILRGAFRDYVIELDKVRSYKGPILEIEEESYLYSSGGGTTKMKKVKYAADIKSWRPLRNAAEKRRKKERQSSPSFGGSQRYMPPAEKAVKALKAAGFDPPLRPVGKTQVLPQEGEAVIFNERGWQKDLHPTVLLNLIDPSTIVYVKGNFGGDQLFTSDIAAVDAARAAYHLHVAEVTKKELAPLRAKLTEKAIAEHSVAGAGALHLLRAINPQRGAGKVVALALGLTVDSVVIDGDEYDDDGDVAATDATNADAELLLSALATVKALGIEVPDDWKISQMITEWISDIPFKVAKSKAPKKVSRAQQSQNDLNERIAAEATANVAKSKKQQKREARAAGKQVGDPARAKSSWPDNPNWTDKPVDVGDAVGEAQLSEEDVMESEGLLDEEEEPEAVEA